MNISRFHRAWSFRLHVALPFVLASHAVFAQCSRPIVVPAAPTGFSVITEGETVRGIYPEWLNALGKRIGCSFEFPVVPRARADYLFFDIDKADILTPASQTFERDAKAEFVHLYNLTPMLITHQSVKGVPPKDITALLKESRWRAAMVRRYSFGNEHDALVRELEAAGRIDFVRDLDTVERMLRAGRVEFTILPASLMYSALLDGKPVSNAAEFHYHKLDGLSPIRSGAYLSTRALPPKDLELLREAMHRSARDGSFKKAHENHMPESVRKGDSFLR